MSENSFTNAAKQQISLKKKESNGTNAAPSLSNSDLLSSLGSSKAMPAGIREKMEGSFGMSLSDVKLFESPVVAENGAQAAASGKNIAFAPGKLDFTSASGQTLLGHELSHVASQARGEVTGHGYLKNSSLEHRADIEGAAAAAGRTLYSAGGLRPMSTDTGLSAGPMQAKASKEERERAQDEVDEANDALMDPREKMLRDDPKHSQSLKKALKHADAAKKVDILRQLGMAASQNPLLMGDAEQAIYDDEISKVTPEMLTIAMDERFKYSHEFMDAKRELLKQNKGKAQRTKDDKTVVSQEQADDDLASFLTNSSDEGSKFLSYSNFTRQAIFGGDHAKLATTMSKHADLLESRNDPDYMAAGKFFDTASKHLHYTLGPDGEDKAEKIMNAQAARGKNWARPWEQKKKSWWHFW